MIVRALKWDGIKMPFKLRCGHMFWSMFAPELRDVECPKCEKRTEKPAWAVRLARPA